MKKIIGSLLVSVMLLGLCLPGTAQEVDAEDRRLVVHGMATVTLPADTARIELGCMTKDSSVEAAQAQNDAVIKAVLDALYGMGIEEKDISTSNYSVYMETPYEEYGSIRKADPIWNVTNMLTVRVRNTEDAGKIIDLATKAGANQVYGVTFSSSKENEGYQQALAAAVADAARNAEVLAKAAGKTLGELIRIENQDASQMGFSLRKGSVLEAADLSAATIVNGETVVTASVALTYAVD